jgi:hypothetical protein
VLGPGGATAEKAYRLLAPRVSAGIRYELAPRAGPSRQHGVPGPAAPLRGVRADRPVPLWPGGACGRESGVFLCQRFSFS